MAALAPSPYMAIGTRAYQRQDGRMVVPVFRSSDARLLLVPASMAAGLSRGDAGVAELTEADRVALEREGLLVRSDEQREVAYERLRNASTTDATRMFVLLPSSYCNMGCEYCGQEHYRGGLDASHRDGVLDRVLTAIQDGQYSACEVRWFGGEPLMAFATIREMSKHFIRAAAEHQVIYRSNIVTNGALLDRRKLTALVRDCRVGEFHITIDGPAEIHDTHRPLKSGGRSFERLVTFLSEVSDEEPFRGTRFVLRTNVDVKNEDHVEPYLRQMASLGFANRANVEFSLVAVHPWSNDVSALELSKRRYASLEAGWMRLMENLGLRYQLLPTAVKGAPCGAVNRHAEVISPSGGVFSCTEQPLVPEHEESSVLIPLKALSVAQLRPLGEYDDWADRVAAQHVPCGTCWLLPACGGSCPKAWDDGDIPCPSMKFNVEDRLDLAARRLGLSPVEDRPLDRSRAVS